MQTLGTGKVLLAKNVSTGKEVSHSAAATWTAYLRKKHSAKKMSEHSLLCVLLLQVAIKVLNRNTPVLQEVETELLNYSSLCHPHVVQFREVFLTDQHVSRLHAEHTTKHSMHSTAGGSF
jgi:hypothetical protein